MPPTGSTFTDWQQVDAAERRLLMDEDFSWSEPPARARRRRVEEPRSTRRRAAVAEREQLTERHENIERELVYSRDREQAAETESEFDALMLRWNESYGEGASVTAPARPGGGHAYATGTHQAGEYDAAAQYEAAAQYDPDAAYDPDAFDYGDLARYTQAAFLEDSSAAQAGHAYSAEPDAYLDESGRRTVVITGRGAERYTPGSRRRPASDLRFHERSGFNPDRTAMWAVLLGLALLVGCVVH